MKIAITGGTGFVGGHLGEELVRRGHEAVLISRGRDSRNPSIRQLPRASFFPIGTNDPKRLEAAFSGCEAIAHCAGINREIGDQTYQRVHIEGTKLVVDAARRAGANKIALISFLRARPNCGSAYHESKWAAEDIVRSSGLDYTILKCGVIYGKGDHMLDHLAKSLSTLPIFARVGLQDKTMRPVAVEDVVQILCASLLENRLSRQTAAVMGPEEITLTEAVGRVARALGKRVFIFPSPVIFSYILGWFSERLMTIPVVSKAQVRILSEGLVQAEPPCASLPPDLAPTHLFTEDQIRKGLPDERRFTLDDLLFFHERSGRKAAKSGGV